MLSPNAVSGQLQTVRELIGSVNTSVYRDLRYNNRRSGHSTPVINESGFGVLMMPSESFRELAVWGRWIAIAFGTWCAVPP